MLYPLGASASSFDALLDNLWVLAVAIVVIGLALGFRDVIRFSITRVWAISGVCFDESIRRRVLWITPLAILGVVVISQLTRPLDEQDAIRQTTKFCLFASGLLVTVTIIILASTNLPREIENRVIFTIVSKPTTRLEIILGKVIGFARVCAVILLIMGVFSWSYLHLRAWWLIRDLQNRLADGSVEEISRPALEHYASVGLLSAKGALQPARMQMFGRLPRPGEDRLWFAGGGEQNVLVPFDMSQKVLEVPGSSDLAPYGFAIQTTIGYERPGTSDKTTLSLPATNPSSAPSNLGGLPTGGNTASWPSMIPAVPSITAATKPSDAPLLEISVSDQDGFAMVGADKVVDFRQLSKTGQIPAQARRVSLDAPEGQAMTVRAFVPPTSLSSLKDQKRIFVMLQGNTPDIDYWVSQHPVRLFVLNAQFQPDHEIPVSPSLEDAAQPATPIIRGRSGTYGEQLKGRTPDGRAPVAVYEFANAFFPSSANQQVPFEFTGGIERNGTDPTEADVPTIVSIQIRNKNATGVAEPIHISVENNRPAFFTLPEPALKGGNFTLVITNLTNDHWLGLRGDSMLLINQSQPFSVNLFKSLFIMWLMSLLIIIIAVFCSTFVSWPIAIVLTLVILLGHWGVTELGDSTAPGLGNQVVTDMGIRNAASSKVVSSSVEALTKFLTTTARFLPDISSFSATDDIERGLIIPPSRIYDALSVVGGFGLSIMVMAYWTLKKKEVAP